MRQTFEQAYGMTAPELLSKWEGFDPKGFDLLKSQRLKLSAAVAVENVMRQAMAPDAKYTWKFNQEARDYFAKEGALAEQVDIRYLESHKRSAEAAPLKRMVETMTTSDVATIARALVYVVVRAFAENPMWNVITTINMASRSVWVAYEDLLWDSTTGAYPQGDRVDLEEDPLYADRGSCTADAALLKLRYQAEQMTAEDKLLGAQVCLSAIQDAQDQYGRNPQEILPARILRELSREIIRKATSDWLNMGTWTASWSQTATGVYTTLSYNEYRKTLGEAILGLSTTIEKAVFEGAQFIDTTIDNYGILKKILRYTVGAIPQRSQDPAKLSTVSGEFGETFDEMDLFRDPFMDSGKLLMGVKQFTVGDHAGQVPYLLGLLHMADQVAMLYHPGTTVMEMAAQSRYGRKMLYPSGIGTLTVTA